MLLRSDRLPVQLEIETGFEILALMLIKQAVSLSRFPRVFPEISDPFVSDATWVGSCFFGGFVWKHVVPLKSLLLLFDAPGSRVGARRLFDAGSALRLKASLRCWSCDVMGFYKSWIRLDGLSQPMLRRESSGPASGSSLRELESDEWEKQEIPT